jgi:MinD-like ATPase involved in chromosome partitioning or flagellar assembly
VPRPAIVIALPPTESSPVADELIAAGFEVIETDRPRNLELAIEGRRDIAVAILDGEADEDSVTGYREILGSDRRDVPVLMVVSPRAFERLAELGDDGSGDEFFTRPYSADAIRWRVEAMCIRRETVDDGSGPVLQGDTVDWGSRATTIAVFNPKGGVGKTTLATNLAAALQMKRGKQVLLIDADTVTGHVTTSLAIEAVRTVVDSWRDEAEGGPSETLMDIASPHVSGLQVIALTDSPLHTDILEPTRFGSAIRAARSRCDMIVIDLHPSYSTLNQAVFDEADQILVPVTPDVPAIRAAVQLRDVAEALGCLDRLALVVNRANSGVSVADIERTVGMPALAQIRSGGLLFVRAANEGRTVIDMFPKERITEDFEQLADRVLRVPQQVVVAAPRGLRLPTRVKALPAKAGTRA